MKIFLIAAVGITVLVTACKDHKPPYPDRLNIAIDTSNSFDFRHFLDAISLLIGDEENSVVNVDVAGASNLSFRSIGDSRGDPVFVYVLPDRVALGTEASRQLMSIEDLEKTLITLAEAESSSGTAGIIGMASDTDVSGQFGLKVLNVVRNAGIPNIMLATPATLEASRPPVTKKPSSPGQNNKKQNKPEQTTPRKPSD